MIPAGSPQWQQYLFIAASIFLLWEVWRGWRLGFVRGLLRLTALFCAWIGGSAAAGATGTAVAFFSRVPPLFAPAVAGLCIGLGIYIVISLLAGLLFKTTENHSGVVRFFFGVGGALCGVIFGLLLLWAGITLIRGLGALGELRIVQARHEGRSPETEKKAFFLIRLKESLELGVTGSTLKDADPLPTAFYDDMVKISMLADNQEAFERFFQYPGTLQILSNPRVAAVVQDPAMERAVESWNIVPLIHNRNVLAAARDPDLLEQLRSFNLTGALDYAFEPQAHPHSNTNPNAFSSPASQRSPRTPSYGRTVPTQSSPSP